MYSSGKIHSRKFWAPQPYVLGTPNHMYDVCVMAKAGNMTSSIKPLAPRGWAREQACAPVTPARLARSVGGAEPSHQETTGAAGGIGHLVRRPREQSAVSGHLVKRRRQLPAVSGHLVRKRREHSAHRTLRSRCCSSRCARGHQAPRGPQRCGKSIASLTKASATTLYSR